jgi:hypothetical protein
MVADDTASRKKQASIPRSPGIVSVNILERHLIATSNAVNLHHTHLRRPVSRVGDDASSSGVPRRRVSQRPNPDHALGHG